LKHAFSTFSPARNRPGNCHPHRPEEADRPTATHRRWKLLSVRFFPFREL